MPSGPVTVAVIFCLEGEAIEGSTAALQDQGHSERDARTIAKDEVLQATNPDLAEFFDSSYPPETRHDPVGKREWLTSYIESRKRGNSA